jgi:hypothetical protein
MEALRKKGIVKRFEYWKFAIIFLSNLFIKQERTM